MPWKVLITAPAMSETGQAAVEYLVAAGCRVVPVGPLGDPARLPALLAGCQAVIAGREPYGAHLLGMAETADLRIISRWGVGWDNVDLAAAARRGIVVTNTPGLLGDTVADYTFGLLLTLARRLHESHAGVARGDWAPAWGLDVSGQTLGIVGWGAIAQAVARRARGFGMTVLVNTRISDPRGDGVGFVPLDELLTRSDFVSLNSALTPATEKIIGAAQLRRMRRTAVLINTARGALVDETALARALQEGWIAGAALDVFVREPLPAESPLRTAPNTLLQPHHASFARGAGARVSLAAARAVVDLMQGRRPAHVLNPEARP